MRERSTLEQFPEDRFRCLQIVSYLLQIARSDEMEVVRERVRILYLLVDFQKIWKEMALEYKVR